MGCPVGCRHPTANREHISKTRYGVGKMDGFKNILFPVDLTETSSKIVVFVQQMAEKFHAVVHVVHVVDSLEHFSGFYVPHPSLETFSGDLKEGSRRRMAEFFNEHFPLMENASCETLLGDPAETIIHYAQDHDIDLIIMGTHGRKGLDRLFFGSVAEKVVKMSPVPVMTVNPHKIQ